MPELRVFLDRAVVIVEIPSVFGVREVVAKLRKRGFEAEVFGGYAAINGRTKK